MVGLWAIIKAGGHNGKDEPRRTRNLYQDRQSLLSVYVGRGVMERPERLKGEGLANEQPFSFGKVLGHNQACDVWEKFLPSRVEIRDILEACPNNQIAAREIYIRLGGSE